MPDVYSGWTMTIPAAETWRASAHCPDKYKIGKPYTIGDVSALHTLLDSFLTDLGVKEYVFPEIIHRPVVNSLLSWNWSSQPVRLKIFPGIPEAGERVIILARRHDENLEPLLENDFDRSVKVYLDRAGFTALSPWQNILWGDDGVVFI